jgi:hypothetical protein
LIPVDTGRPGDLLAVARHPRFIPKVTVMEPHVHALSLPIYLLLWMDVTQSCPKLPTLSAPLRHCFPAMQRHHHREHLPISVLSSFVSPTAASFIWPA